MNLLTQNGKMKKSSKNGITNVNWTIPAFQSRDGFKTCPNAGACAAGCYARSGTYAFGNVKTAHETKLELTKSDEFIGLMISEIETWLNKKSVDSLKIRIHDAGDFYDQVYLNRWIEIMRYFVTSPRVTFYAYTKQIKLFKDNTAKLPANFQVIYSFGGKQDALIDLKKDRHARVFESETELKAAGYVDGTQDDMVAAMGLSNKIGLVYHGAKNFSNTAWDRVKAA